MTRSKTYTPALREEAVKLVRTQGLTLEGATAPDHPQGHAGQLGDGCKAWHVAQSRYW
ncbi:hypothetical protein [Janthinobacterium svalbardensis]|uniref:hypothetical protein n=1 Tax=Janthinobacterium svalbardensis TaxID=368607 RepID=UPI00142DF490|nr:hypothetical protein [Janthinobacterium svalbardensis]